MILKNPGYVVVPVFIDDALGKDTVIGVKWTVGSALSVSITGPDNIQIDQGDPRYIIDESNKVISVTLLTAKVSQCFHTFQN